MKHATGAIIPYALRFVAIGIVSVAIVFPIVWVFLGALKTPGELFQIPPVWFSAAASTANFEELLARTPLLNRMYNSVVIALGTMIIAIPLGCLAAYSLARFRFRGNRDIAFWVLSTRFLPPVAVAIPVYLIMQSLSLLDTHVSVILMHAAINLPFVVWMMRGFYMSIPSELEESAMIDGLSRLGAFARVVFPLSAPGLAATAAFTAIFSWNEFLFAMVLTLNRAVTVPREYAGLVVEVALPWGTLCAAAILMIVPLLIFTIIVQRYMISALTWGAVKG